MNTALIVALLCHAAAPEPPNPPPNIVLMYVDNLGYGDFGCYGNREVQTPRVDRLAAEAVRCTDFYVVASSCTPSRGALLTGRYPLRNGLSHQLVIDENWHGVGLPQRERILPQFLRPAGYATGCFGKWNIGFAPGSRPTERGFDEFFGCRSGNINYFAHTYHGEYDMYRGITAAPTKGYSTELFADEACDFIRRHAARPFFAYVPFNAPHFVGEINVSPAEKPQWQAPAKYFERYGKRADEQDEKLRYFAVLTAIDDAVGRILDTLEEHKLRERTLVILLSDMGSLQRPGQGLGVASNGPYRDGAPTVYEGGIRVPCMVRWPGRLPAGTVCKELLSQLDLLPLCLSAAGVERPADRVLDGVDPTDVLAGRANSPHQRLVFRYKAEALREGPYKIVRNKPTQPWELYQLDVDPAEQKNLAAAEPQTVARLDAQFTAWQTAMQTDASAPEKYVSQRAKPDKD